jgi:Transposase
MARKGHSNEDCLKILREIEVKLASGSDASSACRSAGISDATYYTWRKKGRRHGALSAYRAQGAREREPAPQKDRGRSRIIIATLPSSAPFQNWLSRVGTTPFGFFQPHPGRTATMGALRLRFAA